MRMRTSTYRWGLAELNSTHNSNISKKLAYSSENHLEEIKVTPSDFKTSFKVTVIKIVLLAKLPTPEKVQK